MREVALVKVVDLDKLVTLRKKIKKVGIFPTS